MNILYLHGLESSAVSPKVEYLRMIGNLVTAPTMDYKDPDQYQRICDIILTSYMEEPVDLIIGSSMGGYFAYHLGKQYDIPVLLLNPALHSRTYEPVISSTAEYDPLIFLGVGEHDGIIDYRETLNILDNNVGEAFFRGNYWKGDHGHKTPIDFFQKVFAHTEERLFKISL